MEEIQCRICLEEEPNDFISPCQCRGTQRFVHRECLDEWRRQNINESFYRCNTCHFRYRLSRVWWGKLLSHPATPIIGSALGIGCICYGTGYFSASLYNSVHYWLKSLPYHYPNRYQTIFHGLAWLGIPGLFLLGRDISNSDINVQDVPRVRTINIPQFHYHIQRAPEPRREVQEEKKEDNDNDNDKDKKKKKVAPQEDHSAIFWIMFGIGAIRSYYETYKWVYQKCLTYAARARTIIENVN